MELNIGIKPEHLSEVAKSLSCLLADEVILYTKTKDAHWNIEGVNFQQMHLFFEEQYEKLDEVIDAVAERIRMLGHFAPASLTNYLTLTRLSNTESEEKDSVSLMSRLLSDHETIIKILRTDIVRYANDFSDLGTSDFITGLMAIHESIAWKLRAHMQ